MEVNMAALINLKNGYKIYKEEGKVYALNDVSLEINEGELIVILGMSGSGKTTLLNVLSGLDKLSKGEYYFNGDNIKSLSNDELTNLRKDNFGLIFQSYNLLEHLNVVQNVKLGAMLNKSIDDKYVEEIIELVGLKDKIKSKIYELSGGQQQRVAIARAIAKKPKVLFCDEPTGALDETTSKEILKLILELNEKLKSTIVIITHNPVIAGIADRIIYMKDGRIEKTKENSRKDIFNIEWSI
jgi:putative ABC transport system ATP-binding protein